MTDSQKPTLISGADHKALRDIFRTNGSRRLESYQQTPQAPVFSFLAKAKSSIEANNSGQFELQDQQPGASEDSGTEVTAYTLVDVASEDIVPLLWIATVGSGGGYWLAAPGGGSSLCFSPCDLFSVLDSLTLDEDARSTLATMKAACGCDVACNNCPEIPREFSLTLDGVSVTQGIVITLDNGFTLLEAELSTTALQSIINEISIPLEIVTLVDAEVCVWQGTQEITRNLLVQRLGFGTTPGIPGTYQFTFKIRADFLFGDDWSANIFVDEVSWNGDPAIMGSIFAVDADDEFSFNFKSDETSETACGQTTSDVTVGDFIPGAYNDPYDLSNAILIIEQAPAAADPVKVPLTGYLNDTYFYDPNTPEVDDVLPLPESPSDGDFVRLVFGGNIAVGETVATNLSFTGGDVFSNFPADVSSGDAITLQYRAENSKWYIV